MSLAHVSRQETVLPPAPQDTPVVFVVDDDISVRESLVTLIRSRGWRPETFASAPEFLAHPRTNVPSCLIVDLAMPEYDGLEIQKRLAAERSELPIVFVTERVDIPTTVEAMKAGALGVLTKPLDRDVLLHELREAIERSRMILARKMEMRELRNRYTSLTRREREVMSLVVSGLLNKQIGAELGISEITVKSHRGQAMQKMKANSLPDLVKMASKLHIESPVNTSGFLQAAV